MNWKGVLNKKLISFIDEKCPRPTDNTEYFEFILGGFGNQFLVNVLIGQERNEPIENARWWFIREFVYPAIRAVGGMTNVANALADNPNPQYPVIIY